MRTCEPMTAWVAPNSEFAPPKQGEPPLHGAARTGDVGQIKTLIQDGVPIDDLFEIQLDPGARQEPSTPLMVAAGSGDGATAETLQLLLDLGASVAVSPSGVTALWYASGGLGWNYPPGGDAARVAMLLAAGADPNTARPPRSGTGPGISALAHACGAGDAARVALLLDAGANPEPAGALPPFQVPLYQAAESGSAACVSLLLEAGVDPKPILDDDEDPPIASVTSLEALEALLAAGADPHAPCSFGSSIIRRLSALRISTTERVAMCRLLISLGVNIDEATPLTTALASAAMNAEASAVDVLLKAGADPLAKPNALGAACFLSFDERHDGIERVIELLVEAGLDPNETDENGLSPLHAALAPSSYGTGFASSDGLSVAATIALLHQGASIDVTFPNTGYRPLHAAAAAPSDELVSQLISAGADLTERTIEGLSPADVAREALDRLLSSKPTIEHVRTIGEAEATAQRRLRKFQRDHDHRVECSRRCVEILTSSPAQ